MKKTQLSFIFLIVLVLFTISAVKAQVLTENFDNVPVPNWTTINNSSTIGSISWIQGNTSLFSSQSGVPNSYIGVGAFSTTGTNTISNWLISPVRTFNNGDVIRFWTRTTQFSPFPDRLQVRLSGSGSSTNVGIGATAVGDFSTLLLDINPNYTTRGYPEVWTEYIITLSLPVTTSGRVAFRYFVENGGPSGNNSNYIGIDSFSYTPNSNSNSAHSDFDGDGKSDLSVFRPSDSTWYLNRSSQGFSAVAFGLGTDKLTPADFDGDGRTDYAVWREAPANQAAFYIFQSTNNTVRTELFGQTGDKPNVVGDYDGDGKADPAVYRNAAFGNQSYFFYRGSLNNPNGNITFLPWGINGDEGIRGDFDGDGKQDAAVYRPSNSTWYILKSSNNSLQVNNWGLNTDKRIEGDFDGDRKTDFAVFRPSDTTWYIQKSSDNQMIAQQFGLATDQLTPADYDGDGKTDIAVFRNGTWFVSQSSNSALNIGYFGTNGDTAIPSSFIP